MSGNFLITLAGDLTVEFKSQNFDNCFWTEYKHTFIQFSILHPDPYSRTRLLLTVNYYLISLALIECNIAELLNLLALASLQIVQHNSLVFEYPSGIFYFSCIRQLFYWFIDLFIFSFFFSLPVFLRLDFIRRAAAVFNGGF